ncbi:hypothetical protein [Radiobacillus sp. PE A8.2]|uniref:hypothetical protein n=1 Tax=Radiobacillus sp. PE A8.2 TaxID=3380349 RepID=UPI0038907938
MIEYNELKKLLLDHQQMINMIDPKSLAIQEFLHTQSRKQAVDDNHVFTFVYRNYHNLTTPSLTAEFETKYFQLMEQVRKSSKVPNITQLTYSLYVIKNRYNNPNMQFPLVIDMVHTFYPHFPTFSQAIVQTFKFPTTYHLTGFYKKMARSIEQYRYVHDTYQQLLQEDVIQPLFKKFDEQFPNNNFGKVKKLDLIVNQLGEIK